MAVLSPNKYLLKETMGAYAVVVAICWQADNNDTIELPTFFDDDDILSAFIVDMRDGAEITQGSISNNVLTISDATVEDDPIMIFAFGYRRPG